MAVGVWAFGKTWLPSLGSNGFYTTILYYDTLYHNEYPLHYRVLLGLEAKLQEHAGLPASLVMSSPLEW